MKNYLEFERDIKDLEEELEKLKDPFNKEGISEVEACKRIWLIDSMGLVTMSRGKENTKR